MCLMDIHAGQRTVTMVQAMAHNTSTVDRDLDMLREVLASRGQVEAGKTVEDAQAMIHAGYAALLDLFGGHVLPEHEGQHGHAHGSERGPNAIANADDVAHTSAG